LPKKINYFIIILNLSSTKERGKPMAVVRLYHPSDKELLVRSVGKRLVCCEHGVPAVGKTTAVEDRIWGLERLNVTHPDLVSISYPDGPLQCVVIDPDEFLTKEEVLGGEISRVRAGETMDQAQDLFSEVVKSQNIIFLAEAGDNRPMRYAMVSRAKEHNSYIHSRYFRIKDFATAVLWNKLRLRKVSIDVLWETYKALPEAWEVLKEIGDSYEIVDVEPVNFLEVAQKVSLEGILQYLAEVIATVQRDIEQAQKSGDLYPAQEGWKAAREILTWKDQILNAYQSQEGLESVTEIWISLKTVQQMAWTTWLKLEKRERIQDTMEITQQAWAATAKLSEMMQQCREMISEDAYKFTEQVSIQGGKKETSNSIKYFKQIIYEAKKAAQETQEASRLAWENQMDWEQNEKEWHELYGEISKDLDIYGAGLEALKAWHDWQTLDWETALDDWLTTLDAQLVIMTQEKQQNWNQQNWDEAVIAQYKALEILHSKLPANTRHGS
jgi:hypothetical protein